MIDAKTAYFRYFTHRFQRICIRPNLGSIQINKIAYNRALSRIYSLNIKCYRLNVQYNTNIVDIANYHFLSPDSIISFISFTVNAINETIKSWSTLPCNGGLQ